MILDKIKVEERELTKLKPLKDNRDDIDEKQLKELTHSMIEKGLINQDQP